MKYMILTFASQQNYEEMAGRQSAEPAWTAEDFAAVGAFMQAFSQELLDSGELVETRGLSAPVHTRRVGLREGVPMVTDGTSAKARARTCFDRATEIAARLAACPGPEHVRARAFADVRPVDEHQADYEG